MSEPSLSLLRIETEDGPVFLVVDHILWEPGEDSQDLASYFYEERTCPHDILKSVVQVFTPDDDDPHGLFEHIRTVRKPAGFDGAAGRAGILRELFPETGRAQAALREGEA